jgi:hypothetical protein
MGWTYTATAPSLDPANRRATAVPPATRTRLLFTINGQYVEVECS